LSEEKNKKKKKATFRKVEEGMILEREDGKTYAVGLPETVEKMTGAEGGAGVSIMGIGGKVRGQQYSKVKYKWVIVSGSPLPHEEMKKADEDITATSGTIVASLSNASVFDTLPKCEKCGTPLLIVGEGFKCPKCGKPTV